MRLFRGTVAQKIAAGYLLVILFCVGAAVYALVALGVQNRKSQQLVTVDFRAMSLARDMRSNLLTQERLERQLLILHDPELAGVLRRRQDEFAALWNSFKELPEDLGPAEFDELVAEFESAGQQGSTLFTRGLWDEGQQLSREVLSPARNRLVGQVEHFLNQQDAALQATLGALSREGDRAFRITLTLVFAGIGLAGLVASRTIFKLHQAVATLTRATREVAKGRFDHSETLESDDEFGELARDFGEMAEQLKELERQRLDANPLTRLPGNLAIERELQARLDAGGPFAHVYIDLDHFKAYNDRYGYQAGSEVIAAVGDLVKAAVRSEGTPEDVVGHIGGDDYVVFTTPDRSEPIAKILIRAFDEKIPEFYSEADRRAGYFVSEDRYGVERRFPLLTMSVAIIVPHNLADVSPVSIGRECAKIKEHLKKLSGSNYLVDRRERL